MALPTGQRERFLRAMGYRPLRLRGADAESAETVVPAPSATVEMRTRSERSAPSARQTPVIPTPPAAQAAAQPRIDPLLQALLNAAAAAADDIERLGWDVELTGPAFAFDGPRLRLNPIALRADPAAKRALWKTLRKLRRRHLDRMQ